MRAGQKMKSELKEAPCLPSLSPLQMQIKIHTHTQVCVSYLVPCMHTSLMFLAQHQTFPISLKTCSLQVCFSSRLTQAIQPRPQPVKYFQHFPHTEKKVKRYRLIKKKSCLWLLFSNLLFCPPRIKLFLKCAHVSNIIPLLPSSELCNSSAAFGTGTRPQTDRWLPDVLPT